MKAIKILFLLPLLAMIVASCGQETNVIDNVSNNWNFLAVSSQNPTRIDKYNVKTGNVLQSDVLPKSAVAINSKITKIAEQSDIIYVIVPDDYKIISFTKNDFKLLVVYDFSGLGIKPTDIAFTNPTDAYVSHEGTNKVSVLDLKYGKVATQLEIGGVCSKIAANGNQVYCLLPEVNEVSIIDTRDMKEVARLATSDRPSFIGFTATNEYVIVSSGYGKLDTLSNKTDSKFMFIDPLARKVLAENLLAASTLKAVDQVPVGFALTNKNYGFVATNQGLIRIDTKGRTSTRLINKNSYSFVHYDSYEKKVLLINKLTNTLILADEISGAEIYSIALLQEISIIHPLH